MASIENSRKSEPQTRNVSCVAQRTRTFLCLLNKQTKNSINATNNLKTSATSQNQFVSQRTVPGLLHSSNGT